MALSLLPWLLELAFLQELLILITFAISFSLWRYLKTPRFPKASSKKTAQDCPGQLREERKSWPSPRVAKVEAQKLQEDSKCQEIEMLALLANGEFTRALNAYRRCERRGQEVFFSEGLFTSLVQSSIRVGKMDVVERTLRTMKRIKIKPSLLFWQHLMKMLSSRKQFGLCLVAYGIFEQEIQIDKVIFSCLINAALESKHTKHLPALLEKFSQASITPKDHILHFRCYLALGNATKAAQLFRSLAPEVTNLMLNLSLHALVNQTDPEAAYTLLKEAKSLERKHPRQEKLVDVVSYNTVMKGFGAAKCQSRCFECMKDLIEHGLQPNDITLASLMDASLAAKDHQLVNEIGDFVLANPSKEMKPWLSKAFLRGLVKVGEVSKALDLYEVMRAQSVALTDIVVFNVLIKALVERHQNAKAFELVDDLKSEGLQVDDILLTHLLDACRHDCNYSLGKKFYDDAVDSGLIPSDVTLVALLKLLGACDAVEEGFHLLKKWESLYQRRPSVIHYTCLMKGCFRCKSYDLAWDCYQLMLASGVQPDETLVSTMLSGMLQGMRLDKVEALTASAAQKAAERGGAAGGGRGPGRSSSRCPRGQLQVMLKKAASQNSAR